MACPPNNNLSRVKDSAIKCGPCDSNGSREFHAPATEKQPVLRMRWYVSPFGNLRARFRKVFE